MARKSLLDVDPRLHTALEEFKTTSIVKLEGAKDAYDCQDDETKAAIDRIHATLQQHATGYINVKVARSVVPVKIDSEYLGYNLFWLATQIASDLAFVGLRLAGYQFPPQRCVSCGTEIE